MSLFASYLSEELILKALKPFGFPKCSARYGPQTPEEGGHAICGSGFWSIGWISNPGQPMLNANFYLVGFPNCSMVTVQAASGYFDKDSSTADKAVAAIEAICKAGRFSTAIFTQTSGMEKAWPVPQMLTRGWQRVVGGRNIRYDRPGGTVDLYVKRLWEEDKKGGNLIA